MKFLIFEPSINGHHLEYVTHMMNYAMTCKSEDNFCFVLNEKYRNNLYSGYVNKDNIKVFYISDNYSVIMQNSNILVRSYKLTICLKKYIKEHKPDRVILPYLPPLIPLLPLFVYKKNLFRGIIFKTPSKIGDRLKLSILDSILYKFIYKFKCFEIIWVVNNKYIVTLLNEQLNTKVFSVLPDPINVINNLNTNIINKYKHSNRIILFHGGGMDKSKGTIDFINALKLLPVSVHKNYIIIFGGKMQNSDEKQILYDFIEDFPSYNIIYDDNFLTYEDLCTYISISDYVVIPYKRTEQSSGILGYSALYGIPVIGPKKGLLGKLIVDNKLGYVLDNITPDSLAAVILSLKKDKKSVNDSVTEKYVSDNSIIKFVSSIFSNE